MQEHLQRLELRMRQRQGSVSAASVGRAIEATIKPQNIRLLVPDLRLPTEGDARSFLQALGRFAGVHSLPAGCEWVDTLTVKEHEARNARLTASAAVAVQRARWTETAVCHHSTGFGSQTHRGCTAQPSQQSNRRSRLTAGFRRCA